MAPADDDAPKLGRGKVVQIQKREMKALRDEWNRKITKADKATKIQFKKKYEELEHAMLLRHEAQLRNYDGPRESSKVDDTEKAPDGIVDQKGIVEQLESLRLYNSEQREPSKSRQRREKKLRELEERNRKKDEEVRSSVDYGALERQEILELLKPLDLSIYDIAADGDCLFRSLSHQMQLEDQSCTWTAANLRRAIADHMLRECEQFQPFVDEQHQSDAAFRDYCDKIRDDEWGGEMEIQAAALVLQRPIHVFAAPGDTGPLKYGEDISNKSPLRICFHRHLFASGPHYNSVVRQQESTSS